MKKLFSEGKELFENSFFIYLSQNWGGISTFFFDKQVAGTIMASLFSFVLSGYVEVLYVFRFEIKFYS